MQKLSSSDYDHLIDGARSLDPYGKLYETPDGRIIKLFRIKRRLSSNLWSPHATRFTKNAARLNQLGFPAPHVSLCARIPHVARQVVVYPKLDGVALRDVLRSESPERADACMRDAARFVAAMHERGVLFRSFHLGNILMTPSGDFALIDILDARFKRSSLSLRNRRRNLGHLSIRREDHALLLAHWAAFSAGYLDQAATGSMKKHTDQLAALLEEHRAHLRSLSPA